ncbi:hypothetical protein NC651_028909 [Populus alba x Populus x berolinensis]|nr:hypothetical protein NC651_028909 [Populus alba x Populus x berolinensis]
MQILLKTILPTTGKNKKLKIESPPPQEKISQSPC